AHWTSKRTAAGEAEWGGRLHRIVDAGEKVAIGARVGVIVSTRAEYETLLAGADDGNPFLGYIGGGGGAAVRGAVAPQPATDAPGAAPPRAVAGPLLSPRARRPLVGAG